MSMLVVIGCAEHRAWTAFEPMPAPTKRVDGKVVPLVSVPIADVERLDANCLGCHENARDPHPVLRMSCVDCHGGDPAATTKERAHPTPRHPERWTGARNPERAYTLLNEESTEWVRFVNPGDLRVANGVCGGCHPQHVLAVAKSVMTTSAPFFGVASYANGIVPFKRTIFGESYSPEGVSQRVNTLVRDETTGKLRFPTDAEVHEHSYAPFVIPLPHFEATQPGNILRVFEQGSRLGGPTLGQNGQPTPAIGVPDKNEDPGRPNNRLSDRGLGTLNRVDLPLLNVQKTRLNDPHLSFLGTNDQPGDYRSSGCTACHMVYANDRDPVHSGPYAAFGHLGQALNSTDPTIDRAEEGHPLQHKFTNAIPSSQCLVCHMHQPNSFVNTFYGYQMWSYETDGAAMWPKESRKLTDDEWFEIADRNPEAAARRGKWGDRKFLDDVALLNPTLTNTQFSDYHGHGWVFRAVFKTDRKGNLLDKDGNVVPYDDPKKFEGVIPELSKPPRTMAEIDAAFAAKAGKPVHLKDIHAEKGMHCVDCHFSQDVHGDGNVYAEYQAAVEIKCQDCHGTVQENAHLDPSTNGLVTSGPASKGDPPVMRTPSGRDRFAWQNGALVQRSMLYPDVSWDVVQVKDSVTPGNAHYNARAHAAKAETISAATGQFAHGPDAMECHTCHTSWMTSCFGCHLPQEANVKSEVRHFEGGERKNLATYNPQVARDDVFMMGVEGDVKGNRIAPVRSSSAVMISSKDAQRNVIYAQQMTTAANGMSSQCFNTHFAHTVRKTETKSCTDCHPSAARDNNAWLAQVYLLGTNATNFVGLNAWVGEESGFEAARVTEYDEPQAVIGSRLHELAWPEEFKAFVAGGRKLLKAEHHSGGRIQSLQLRGEYLYAACGEDGLRVYDVANVSNKGFSEKIVTAPVSPLGQNTHVDTKFAAAVALPTNNSISMSRKFRPENREQGYVYRGNVQNLHESYRYAYIADRDEGLILVDVDCLTNGDPQDNFLKRALTFDPDHALDGAVNLTVCGTTVYVCCDRGIVAVDIDDPLEPKIIAQVGAPDVDRPTSISVQFRYAFVTDAKGIQVLDVTFPERMKPVEGARVDLDDARSIYVARTWGFVAAGKHGLVVLDVEKPEQPRIDQTFDADGAIDDLNQVVTGMTNDSSYAYLADGHNGLRVLALVTPEDGGRSAYGFSPRPMPRLIATFATDSAALALSKGLDRDRAVDESGHQVAVFGRIGGRPFTLEEMRKLSVVGRDGILEVSDPSAAHSSEPSSPPKDPSVPGGH